MLVDQKSLQPRLLRIIAQLTSVAMRIASSKQLATPRYNCHVELTKTFSIFL